MLVLGVELLVGVSVVGLLVVESLVVGVSVVGTVLLLEVGLLVVGTVLVVLLPTLLPPHAANPIEAAKEEIIIINAFKNFFSIFLYSSYQK